MYNFDNCPSRLNTDSIKWNFQNGYGVKSGLQPFWIADTDFPALPEIMEAIKERCEHPILGYAEHDDSVLDAVSGWFSRRHGWEIPREQMFLGNSIVTGIWFTLQAITEPGDGIMVMTPVYDAFFGAIKNSGRKKVDCPLIHEGTRYSIDFENMEQHFKDGVRVLILCNPHNPVGRVWSRDELSKISSLCEKYNVTILSDEVHCDITLFGNKYTPMAMFPQNLDRLIVYTAITKTFNMAGLSSSCIIIPNEELRGKVKGALYGSWLFGPTSLAFPAIKAAYTHGDEWVDCQNKYIEGNAKYVTETVSAHMPKAAVTDLEGTFLMWLDLRCLGLTSVEISAMMAEKYGLALGKGSSYGTEGEGFMRLNIGCSRATLELGMEKIITMYRDIMG